MFKPLAKKHSKSRGQALVEFALLLPVLFLIVMGIVDLGLGVHYYNTMSNAAREGARFGITLTDSAWTGVYGTSVWNVDGNRPGVPYDLKADTYAANTIAGTVAAKAPLLAAQNAEMTITVDLSLSDLTKDLPREPLTIEIEFTYVPLVSHIIGIGSIDLTAMSVMGVQ